MADSTDPKNTRDGPPADAVARYGEFVTGTVILADALGARDLTEDGIYSFLKNRDDLIDEALREAERAREFDKDVTGLRVLREELGRATFGDSVLLYWEIEAPLEALFTGALLAAHLFIGGLAKGVPLRIAVAFGRYLAHGATVLGPAVSDAARWYEAADWLGAVLTRNAGTLWAAEAGRIAAGPPQCGAVWREIMAVEYEVPLSQRARGAHGRKECLAAVGWPFLFGPVTRQNAKWPDTRARFLHYLSQFPVPAGTESKYRNTMDFFDWCHEKHPDLAQFAQDMHG